MDKLDIYNKLLCLICKRLHKDIRQSPMLKIGFKFQTAPFLIEGNLKATCVENRGHIFQIFIHVKFRGLMGVKFE